MTVDIHPTAIVESESDLDEGVMIGPYAIVEKGAVVGRDTRIEAHAIVKGSARVGRTCNLGHFSVVGGLPQHLSFDPKVQSFVHIGDSVRIGEGVTIHRSIHETVATHIADECFLMGNSHVAHDCNIGKSVVLANGALLGGHVSIGSNVFVGGGAALHQFIRVGDGAMIGGMAEISADVPPQITVVGRNLASGLNLIGLRRRGVSRKEISELKKLYRDFLNVPGNLKARASDLLDSKKPPETELGIRFVEFFLTGDRNFSRSRKISKTEIILETEEEE